MYFTCMPFLLLFGLVYHINMPPFRMEYRHLSKMRGTKKLLSNWNISIFQLLMDCLIYINMKTCNKQWNLLISIFHSSMEFHGTFPCQKGSSMEFHGTLIVPWNFMPTPNSMEFHGIARPRTKVPWNSMKFKKFHIIWLHNQIPWNHYNQLRNSMKFHGILKVPSNLTI